MLRVVAAERMLKEESETQEGTIFQRRERRMQTESIFRFKRFVSFYKRF